MPKSIQCDSPPVCDGVPSNITMAEWVWMHAKKFIHPFPDLR